jgi:histone-binding protein RBBP4
MAEELNEEEEMIINQEYKIWKKESPDYYDFLLLHSLDWPSYTFQWLPEVIVHDTHTSYHALLASSNADPEQSQLLRARIDFPNDNKAETYFQHKQPKVTILQKIQHSGEINRARHCHADPNIVAVATGRGDITLTSLKEPLGKLVGHTAEGYGLSWNGVQKNLLLSGFSDKKICIWDIEQNRQENGKFLPIFEILHHSAPIEDVAWHRFHPSLFASCSDDRLISLWDTRFRNAGPHDDKKPLFEVVAHTDEIYSLDFSPLNEFLFASASADENVSVWDLRNLTRALATLPGEKNAVMKVAWSPFASSVLGSCGYGRNVDIWDLTKERKEQDHPYLFRHMGHRSRVLDLDWHPTEKLLVGSVEENNCLQVWQINRSLYYEEEEPK